MKNFVCALLTLFCTLSVRASDEKMSLRLPDVRSGSEANIYFNATGRYPFVYDSCSMVAKMDIHFDKKDEDGNYGSISIYNMADTINPEEVYIITRIAMLSGDLLCKRIGYTSTIGKREYFESNITFIKKTRDYSIWLFEKPHYFAELNSLVFVSKLRITPRPSTPEELKQDSLKQARVISKIESKREAIERKNTMTKMYLIISSILTVIAIVHTIRFMKVSFRAGRLLTHLLLSAIAIFSSSIPLFTFLPYLPAYYLTYYMIVDPNYTSWEIQRKFLRLIKLGAIAGILLALFISNWNALFYIIQWLAAYWVCWMFYTQFIDRSRCGHCDRYGVHPVVKRQLLWMRHIHTQYENNVHTDTEENEKEIIHWYEKRYGYKLERESHFKDFRECPYCHEIFITKSMEVKTVHEEGYTD